LKTDIENETLWGTAEQISQIFSCSTDNIYLHVKNILQDGELTEESSVSGKIDFMIFMEDKAKPAYIAEMAGLTKYSILKEEYQKYKSNLITKEDFISIFNSLDIVGNWDNVRLIDNPNHQYYNYYCYSVLNPPRDNLTYITVNSLEELFIAEDEQRVL
jgi:DNA-binding XRE family transcriptional regulator